MWRQRDVGRRQAVLGRELPQFTRAGEWTNPGALRTDLRAICRWGCESQRAEAHLTRRRSSLEPHRDQLRGCVPGQCAGGGRARQSRVAVAGDARERCAAHLGAVEAGGEPWLRRDRTWLHREPRRGRQFPRHRRATHWTLPVLRRIGVGSRWRHQVAGRLGCLSGARSGSHQDAGSDHGWPLNGWVLEYPLTSKITKWYYLMPLGVRTRPKQAGGFWCVRVRRCWLSLRRSWWSLPARRPHRTRWDHSRARSPTPPALSSRGWPWWSRTPRPASSRTPSRTRRGATR